MKAGMGGGGEGHTSQMFDFKNSEMFWLPNVHINDLHSCMGQFLQDGKKGANYV